jgi:hypothetical protein
VPARPPAVEPGAAAQRRLLAAQISASLALPAGATAGGLLAVDIAGPAAAALPLALLVAGSGLAAVMASALAARAGRRAGLLAAYAVAAVGATATIAAAIVSSLPLLLAASALLGAGNAAAISPATPRPTRRPTRSAGAP